MFRKRFIVAFSKPFLSIFRNWVSCFEKPGQSAMEQGGLVVKYTLFIEKDKNTSRGWINVKFIPYKSAKDIEALSHVGEALVKKITLMRR